jgi:glutamate-1-semialdehyde aminotransferase
VDAEAPILYRGYHGWQDFWAEQPGWADGAIPARPEPLMHVFKYNDRDDFLRLYEQYKHDLAAVMVEPSPWGGDHTGIELDQPEFLRFLAQSARDAGALLVFDEVFSGYRVPQGTVQRSSGVVPDLACAGKALASGMPLAAAVGRADIMRACMPRIFYPGPTFRGEVYSLAAAKATLELYRTLDVPGHVHDYGTRLREGVARLAQQLGIAASCVGPPYRMLLLFQEPDPDRFRLMRTLFVQEILKGGVTSFLGILIPSYAHDEAALARTLEVFGRALETVERAARQDLLAEHVEIPPVYFG